MPITPHVSIINAAMIATADNGPADDSSTGNRPANMAIGIDATVDISNVPMHTNMPTTNVPTAHMSAAAPCVSH